MSILDERGLAPYATRGSLSRGRQYPEEGHPFRSEFQRDRDRILHSRPFRRLDCKTQVFLNGTGDHYRTRLTHTIEVSAIGRTIARALCLNEDLTEAIALAHDIGHPPFGHTGERELNALASDIGGFDHNDQALRLVDLLLEKYPGFDGLNLNWEVRTGLLKHRHGKTVELDGECLPPMPSLEAQVADLADDLAYYGHDVDDGLDSGLIKEKDLRKLRIWGEAATKAAAKGLLEDSEKFRPYAVRCLVDAMVGDAVRNTVKTIKDNAIDSLDKVQSASIMLVRLSSERQQDTDDLKEFLRENLYFNKKVMEANNSAAEKMRQLYHFYVAHPDKVGKSAARRFDEDGVKRCIADHIAGMTDRFAIEEHRRLCQA